MRNARAVFPAPVFGRTAKPPHAERKSQAEKPWEGPNLPRQELDPNIIQHVKGTKYNDRLVGNHGDNTLDGRGGNDKIWGKGGNDILKGGPGNDKLGGAGGDDTLEGGADHDTLEGGDGEDSLDGGAGEDWATYANSPQGVEVSLARDENGKPIEGKEGHAQGDTLKNIEHLTGSAYDDTLTGDDAANTLKGGAGRDTLEGGPGADVLDGGDGWDVATYENSPADANSPNGVNGVTVDLSDNDNNSGGHAADDTLTHIEHLIGSNHNDTLTGNEFINDLWGGDGNDVLNGAGGPDRLYGGSGKDTLHGGVGDDVLFGDSGGDELNGGPGADMLDGGAGHDVLRGQGGTDRLYGSVGDDMLEGGLDNDTLDGGTGTDRLNGRAGSDVLTGGGPDTGGDGADTFVFQATEAITDFVTGVDKIKIGYVATEIGFNDLDIKAENENVVLSWESADSSSITLMNVDLGELTESHFEFIQA
ncbi:MAG: calcium-binding protein [Rhodobacteraceae bacterium]|nr:calcium-binding protein [Paracoccaceae bacterium]